jgi:hypothetical protein
MFEAPRGLRNGLSVQMGHFTVVLSKRILVQLKQSRPS